MNRSDGTTIVRRVFVTALLLSVVHYIDNTIRFEDYTGGKASDGFITRPMIPISWVFFTAAGVAGYRSLKQGNRALAGSLLAIFSVSGLIGIGHFTTVSPNDFSAFQNTFIALDFLAGLAVFVLAVRIVIEPRGRQPASDHHRSISRRIRFSLTGCAVPSPWAK